MNQLPLDLQPTPEYRLIPLTQGQFAKVDPADFDWLSQWKWQARWSPFTKSFYAERGTSVKGKFVSIKMSRLIMNAPPEKQVDHEDHDTVNNQRRNLRILTVSQNQYNQKPRQTNKTGFTGVSDFHDGWYGAYIRVDGKRICLGCFRSAHLAGKAYLEGKSRHHKI